MNIKTIVFDYGQVISLPQDPRTIDILAGKAGVSREKFEPLLWGLRGEYDRGAVNARQYYKNILSALGVSKTDAEIDGMIAIDSGSWTFINDGTVTLMADVKKAGYKLGILSNMPFDFLAWARVNISVFSLPHFSIFSCEAGFIKPEEAIYKLLLSAAGTEAPELVFFDDNAENIKAAAAMGIKAFLWKNPENARKELQLLGVQL